MGNGKAIGTGTLGELAIGPLGWASSVVSGGKGCRNVESESHAVRRGCVRLAFFVSVMPVVP